MIYKELLKGNLEIKETIDQLFSRLQSKMFKDTEIVLDLKGVILISSYFLDKLEKFIIRSKELEIKILLVNIPPSVSKTLHVLNCKKNKRTSLL